MKCFEHPDRDAVGMCKHCHRGVCQDCVAIVDGSVACRGTCEEEVRQLNALIEMNKRASGVAPDSIRTSKQTYQLMAGLFFVLGLVFFVTGVHQLIALRQWPTIHELILIGLGGAVLAAAFGMLRSARRIQSYSNAVFGDGTGDVDPH